jgi:hypothetical protein
MVDKQMFGYLYKDTLYIRYSKTGHVLSLGAYFMMDTLT